MCSYKTLAHTEDGYIILCNGCTSVQLAFGTTAVKFDQETFHVFIDQIKSLYEFNACNEVCKQKRIHIDVYSDTSMMLVNIIELNKLKHLVELANFNLELESILEENNIA